MSQLSEQRTAQGKDPHLWALDLDPRYELQNRTFIGERITT